ncbi:MAG TPA: glycosyltransferase family 4 protein [Bacteroidia bacterium]|nr:glycosyltransferase family 4 protein [Bacteroidia bacterium]
MKILQICHRIPFPPLDGGNIAMLNMAKSLKISGCDVQIFALNTVKHFVDPNDLPSFFKKDFNFSTEKINTKVTLRGAIKNFFSRSSYNVDRFFSSDIEQSLTAILQKEQFDVIQLETLFTTPYIDVIRKNSKAKIVLRAHNSEHIIWERLSKLESSPFKKWYLTFLASRLKNYEMDVLNKIDAIIPITKIDAAVFKYSGYSGPVLTVPLGIDMEQYPLQKFNPDLSVFHLGSMDWLPNQEAIRWFLFSVWPSIHKKFPALRLHLAGRGFPEDLLAIQVPGVEMQGKVVDANCFMEDKQIMIVPLLSGSGMRVKIIQGLALGKTIISTSIGAEGIEVTNGQNILIADDPKSFLEKIEYCLSDPERCHKIGLNGRKFAAENYSNEVIGQKLAAFYEQLCFDSVLQDV